MRVTTKDIVTAFDDLLTGARSREEIASWAASACAADDGEGLEYAPQGAEDVIWDALLYLMGVDMQDAPGSYLHVQGDFEDYWRRNRSKFRERNEGLG